MNLEHPLPRRDSRYRRISDGSEVTVTYVDRERRLIAVDNGMLMSPEDFYRQYEAPTSGKIVEILIVIVLVLFLALMANTRIGGPDAHDIIDWLKRAIDTMLDQFSGQRGIRQMR